MARTYHKKGIHGSPENAGAKNLKPEAMQKADDPSLMVKLNEVFKMSIEKKKDYNGQYNADQLLEQITLFFDYCAENKLKPTAPLLQLWLGVSKTTMNDWKGFPERYGEKSVVIRTAYSLMESYLQSNIDKYPTGSIFLLKTTHGHVEKSQVDITTNANFTDAELKDKVKQLGLDK